MGGDLRIQAEAAFVATAVLFSATIASVAAADEVSILWVTNPVDARSATVEVHNLDRKLLNGLGDNTAGWERLMSVYASQGSLQADLSVPAMLGTYSARDGVLCFDPAFSLQPGVRYRAVVRAADGVRTAEFSLPVPDHDPSTLVSAVFPSADLLPENLLKFYVHFSAPMSRGHIYDHIELLNDAGKPIELPFLEIDEELWDPDMTRLTLFIDPGRLKRGVKPLEEVGPALEMGRSFTLLIRASWKDSAGQPLVAPFRKVFSVAAPDRTPPDPSAWSLSVPEAGTRQSLKVTFNEPMDSALAQRLIIVTDDGGVPIVGDVSLSEQERHWEFAPASPWRAGRGRLVVRTTIEDLAGNNIGRPFEVDLFEKVERRLPGESIKLAFEIR